MTPCTVCNWTRHDASIHGELCGHGHPIALVGRYTNGTCRECQRATVRRYYWRYHELQLERNRRNSKRVRRTQGAGGGPPRGSLGRPPLAPGGIA